MDPQLFSLLRSFYSLSPTSTLTFPKDCSLFVVNDFLVNTILLDNHFLTYPPSQQYQRRFWKWAIENIEDLLRNLNVEENNDDFEIDPRIYDHYLALMPSPGPMTGPSDPSARSQIPGRGLPLHTGPPSQSYVTHFWETPTQKSHTHTTNGDEIDIRQNYERITLLESRTTIESGTTGLRTWLASFVLAQYLTLHPDIVVSKRVLELGSGIGFLGMIIASLQIQETSPLGRPSLWLTDVNDEVLSRCRDNVGLPCNVSSQHPNINLLKLDWSESQDPERSLAFATLINEKIDPEIILGADVVFDPSLIPWLVGTLKISLAPTEMTSNVSKVALIALTLRNEATLSRFLGEAQESGLLVKEIQVEFSQTVFTETIERHSTCDSVKLFCITKA